VSHLANDQDLAPPAADDGEEGALSRDELKRRASGGIFIVGTRGLAILLIGFGGNVVIARLLTPHDFGLVAIGMAFVVFASLLADGGLGAGLIRRAEPPDIEELQALTALQLAVSTGLALAIAAVAIPFGEAGWVTAVMVCSMPLAVLQFPGRILLERSLSYRPLALVEVSQVLTYYAWAIGFVVAGFGVWGLASATVAMRVAAALIMIRVSPVGLVRPRFHWSRIRPLIGFGVRFQATSATWLVRDQGLNAAIAAIASISTLGLWSLARRLLEVPFLLFDSLWRVSFPTMSQLMAAKSDVAPLIERAVGMAAVGGGVVLVGLAGSHPRPVRRAMAWGERRHSLGLPRSWHRRIDLRCHSGVPLRGGRCVSRAARQPVRHDRVVRSGDPAPPAHRRLCGRCRLVCGGRRPGGRPLSSDAQVDARAPGRPARRTLGRRNVLGRSGLAGRRPRRRQSPVRRRRGRCRRSLLPGEPSDHPPGASVRDVPIRPGIDAGCSVSQCFDARRIGWTRGREQVPRSGTRRPRDRPGRHMLTRVPFRIR
jgi:Polysaccharide biosynthesis protein